VTFTSLANLSGLLPDSWRHLVNEVQSREYNAI